MTVLSYDLSCILNLPFQSVTWKLYPEMLLTSFHRRLNNSGQDFWQMKNVQFIQMSCQPQDKQLIIKKKQQQLLTLEGARWDLGAGIQTSRSGRWARDYNQPTILYWFVKAASLAWYGVQCPVRKAGPNASQFSPKLWTITQQLGRRRSCMSVIWAIFHVFGFFTQWDLGAGRLNIKAAEIEQMFIGIYFKLLRV